jgi:hypothetical protein
MSLRNLGSPSVSLRCVRKRFTLFVFGIALTAAGHLSMGQQPASPKRYLFLDPALIENSVGIDLRVNPPERRETVILPDRPWEKEMISFFLTVRQEGDKLRMWYICRDAQNLPNLAYAESTDGIHWSKPALGIVDYQGSKENNLTGVAALEGVVFKDPNAPQSRQYTYVTNNGSNGGIVRFSSPDGLHWERDSQPLLKFTSDTQNVTFWDEQLKKYVIYLRGWDTLPNKRRKVVRLAVANLDGPVPIIASDNGFYPGNNPKNMPFIHDELPTVLQCDNRDPSRTDIYNISVQPYPVDPSWYVGFPTFLRRSEATDAPGYHGANRGPAEVQFVGSRDGVHWDRYDRAAYVSPGMNGTLSEKVAFMGTGLIVRNGEIWQYGTVFRTEHGDVEGRKAKTDGAIVRYVQREDGFVPAYAPNDGTLRTVPIMVTGKHLIVNVDTGALGQVRAEMLGENRKALPGFSLNESAPLQANSTGATLSWSGNNDFSALIGRKVSLVFHLNRAKLYSFRFED